METNTNFLNLNSKINFNVRNDLMDASKRIQGLSHSGATLSVTKNKSDDFVVEKKIYGGIARNLEALTKQQNFRSITTSGYKISPIPINSIKQQDETLIVEMPYFEGVNGEGFAISGNRKSASNLKVTLDAYLIDLWSKSQIGIVEAKVIVDKVIQIESFKYDELIEKTVKDGCDFVKKNCTSNLSIPLAKCHGDLTLSNMILSQDGLYVFDFLDSGIESPLQDVAKIIQDMKYGWSFRKSKSSLKLKGQIFCAAAYPSFINMIGELYPRELKVIEVLTILRIAPYIIKTDEITKHWFNKTMRICLNEV